MAPCKQVLKKMSFREMFVCKKVSLNLRVWIVADVHEILVLGNPKFSNVNILLLDILVLKYLISLACYFKVNKGHSKFTVSCSRIVIVVSV